MTNWPTRNIRRPWIYGHRGARGAVSENTLLSFETALDDGADGIELDVRLNHEGAIVVFHDDNLERMTEGRDRREVFDVPIRELAKVALNRGGAIPSLPEVLNWAARRKLFLNIELKPRRDDARRLAVSVMQEILQKAAPQLQSRVLLSSFSPDVMAQASEQQWPLPIAFLISAKNLEVPPSMGLTRFGVHPHYPLADTDRLAEFHKLGTFINVWTVNEGGVAEALNALQVDGIVTDEPRRIRDLFD